MKGLLKSLTLGAIALSVMMLGGTAKADDWETTGLTGTAIKVGVMGPFTGNASSYSKTQIGLMAYFKHINDQGGIHGRKFEMFPEDTACAPAKGIAAAKKLVHQDKVFYLHGNSCSAVAMAVNSSVRDFTVASWSAATVIQVELAVASAFLSSARPFTVSAKSPSATALDSSVAALN